MSFGKRRRLLGACGGVVIALSVYSLVFFLRHKIYLIGSDTFYYMAIADSVMQLGSMVDLTVTPARAVITPQNGIVLVHVLLSGLGLAGEGRLVVMVLVNWLLHLSAAYPLYRIAERVGLRPGVPRVALLSVHLGAWHIYRMQLLPINEGVFNPLSIWLTYLILLAFEGNGVLGAVAIALSVVLVHFRLNALLILGAALGAAILTRRRWAMWAGGCLLTAGSLALPYAFANVSGLSGSGDRIWDKLLSQWPSAVMRVGSETIPYLLFTNAGLRANVMYGVFGLALLLAFISGLRQRKAGLVFVCLSCVAGIGLTAGLLDQSYRYVVYVFPLLYLLILLQRKTVSIGYLFVALVLISSVATFSLVGFPRVPASRFWLHVHEQGVELGDEALLVSEFPRHPYFFVGARTFRGQLTRELVVSDGGLFLVGSGRFVGERLAEIAAMPRLACRRVSLTPGYQDEEGHVLLRLVCFEQA